MRRPVVLKGMTPIQDETVQVKIARAPPPLAPEFPQVARVSRRKTRRARRLVRFVVLETLAFAALVILVKVGTSAEFARESLTSGFMIAIFAAAAALAIIPVVFFGLPRRHDSLRRYR